MPQLSSRLDVKMTRENRQRLHLLRKQIKEQSGKSIPLSTLVDEIVTIFFEKEELLDKAIRTNRGS